MALDKLNKKTVGDGGESLMADMDAQHLLGRILEQLMLMNLHLADMTNNTFEIDDLDEKF